MKYLTPLCCPECFPRVGLSHSTPSQSPDVPLTVPTYRIVHRFPSSYERRWPSILNKMLGPRYFHVHSFSLRLSSGQFKGISSLSFRHIDTYVSAKEISAGIILIANIDFGSSTATQAGNRKMDYQVSTSIHTFIHGILPRY